MNKGGSTVVPKCPLFKVCTILSTVILSWFVDCQIKEAVLAQRGLCRDETRKNITGTKSKFSTAGLMHN